MAFEYRTFAVAIPAGTAIAAPQITNLAMPARIVRAVRIRIPPGPNGQVGFALGAAGVRIIPYGANQWLVGNDEIIDWPLEGQISSGAWQFQGYNLGANVHTIYVSFALDPPQRAGGGVFGVSGPPLVVTPDGGGAGGISGSDPGGDVILSPAEPPSAGAGTPGWDLARSRAIRATEAALGLGLTEPAAPAPAADDPERADYDAGKAAAIAALEAL